jgi:hypothetical protein
LEVSIKFRHELPRRSEVGQFARASRNGELLLECDDSCAAILGSQGTGPHSESVSASKKALDLEVMEPGANVLLAERDFKIRDPKRQ